MAFYSDELVEEVRSRSDIVTVIGSRVRLTKKGANYFGCCPFHNEKTPSFSVSPQKQMYYCFGCGAGGNVVTFLMNYENISFTEAMKELAARAGITLPEKELTEEERREKSIRARLLEMNGEAAKFYFYLLRQEVGKTGMEYFARRGLSQETMRRFGLGYSPDRWDALYRYLKSKGFSDGELKSSGLVKERTKDGRTSFFDMFRNRVMYPIMDKNSKVIGFGGRVIGQGEPKYLNSPETPVFDKGRNLYGLHIARSTRRPYMILCEGYMDVIALHQAGIDCAVASLGTALTSGNAFLLKRHTDTVLLSYDSDGAGVKAAMRAIPLLRQAGVNVKVINMRPHKDPDEFIVHEGLEAYEERIRNAQNFFLYQSDVWKTEYDLKDPAGRTAYQKKLAEGLVSFEDPMERENYILAVCEYQRIDAELLRGLVGRIGNGRIRAEETEAEAVIPSEEQLKQAARKEKDEGILSAQQVLLHWAAMTETPAARLRELLVKEDFVTEPYGEILEHILKEHDAGRPLMPAAILNRYLEDEEKSKLAAAIFSKGISDSLQPSEKSRLLSENLRRLRKYRLDRELRDETDPQRVMLLARQLAHRNQLLIREQEV